MKELLIKMRLNPFRGNPNLKRVGEYIPFEAWHLDEIMKCQDDPIYFIENYCKIVSLDKGEVLFKLYDCQKRKVKTILDERFVLDMESRQSGKTQTAAACILWYVLFNEAKTVAILANKAAAAREVLSRLRFMFERLPKWLQHGIVTWNKGDIELENGSKVFTAATSATAVTGRSCVSGDTKITVKNKLTGEVKNIEIQSLRDYEDEISGILDKMEETISRQIIDISEWEVLTPTGFQSFDGLSIIKNRKVVQLITETETLICTPCHQVQLNDGTWSRVDELCECSVLFGDICVIDVLEVDDEIDVYDLTNVKNGHAYYTNDIVSHNCSWVYVDEAALIPNNLADEFFTSAWPTISSGKTTKFLMSTTPRGYNFFFKWWSESENGLNDFKRVFIEWHEIPGRDEAWLAEQRSILGELKFNQEIMCHFLGSSGTLINASKIAQMAIAPPLYSKDNLDILEYPIKAIRDESNNIIPGHTYVLIADVSRGVGGDHSAFTVIDVTMMPYKLVAKYRDNLISPLLFPNIIHKVAKDYNDAFVLVEIKENGQQIADILQYELEYENILHVTRGQGGQHITAGFGSRTGVQNGVMTSTPVKRIGCDAFKSMVEENKLLINDVDVISEISTFIEVKNSYAADEGYHDDLVMCLVLFGWITSNPFFKDMTNTNIREKLYAARMEDINNSLTPKMQYDNGLNSGYTKFEDSAGNKYDLTNVKEQIDDIRWLFD